MLGRPILSQAISPLDSTIARRTVAIAKCDEEHATVSHRILHARRVLVGEASNIFAIRADKAGTWYIAGIPLHQLDQLRCECKRSRSLIPDHTAMTNAALSHAVHLVSLISRYLSIDLPFPVTFTRQTHVGRPIVRANTPFLNTTKFREKYTLWLSAGARRQDVKAGQKYRHFLTALALFAHSVCYLAWSQGVEGIGVATDEGDVRIPATSILQLLEESTQAIHLGERSHEPGTTLVRHLGFSLDVLRVVEAVLGPEDDSGWDIVDA